METDLEQDIEKDLMALSARNTFAMYNHIHVAGYSRDRAVMELKVEKDSLNPLGLVHGGALFTMGDCAAGFAARTDGRRYVTMASDFHFLRGGRMGDVLRAEGTVRRRGMTTCLSEVSITNQDGELLATGTYTFYCIGEEEESLKP